MRVLVQAVLTFLLNASWQIALIVGFAILSDWLLRGVAARYRHALWITTLIACLILPMLSVARLRKPTEWPQPAQSQPATSAPVVLSRIITPNVEIADQKRSDPTGSPTVEKQPVASRAVMHIGAPVAFTISAIYLLFLLWRTLVLVRSWRRTHAIVKSAHGSVFPDHVQSIIRSCRKLIGVRRVRIMTSQHVPVPITLGVTRPVIVLPERLLQETDRELLSTAVGHELVHVARRDYLWNLLFEFIYLPLSIHPAVALVRRRIRQTRELCCDEVVATKVLRAEVYAASLMRLIEATPSSLQLISDTTIGLNQSDILEVRIMSLLKPNNRKSRHSRILGIAAALVLLTPCVVAARFAFKLNVEPQVPASNPTAQEKQERENSQQRVLQELRQQARDLNEKLKSADESKRAEIEARLLEVQKNLEQHERALTQVREQRESLENLRAALDEYAKNKTGDVAQLRRMEERLAQIETEFPGDDTAMREAKEKLAKIETGAQENRRAKLTYRVEPEYPADAREKGIEGTVLLGVTVSQDGLPQNIQVKRSLYPSLDQSAIEALKKWRFEPALKDGQPVSTYLTIEFNFSKYSNDKEALEKTESGEFASQPFNARRKKKSEEQEQDERSRRQADLTRDAVIPMDRAIQIAISAAPGKVLACSLGRDGSNVFYHIVIVGNEDNHASTTYVWVSATDGHVIKTEKEKTRAISGGLLNSKALSLPNPAYPEIARAAGAEGTVRVQIVVDEQGNVIEAKAVSGHPLLLGASVTAARQAKFAPTRLEGEPVKVTGYLSYNFTAQ